MDSILTSVKKVLGITAEYTHFDNDLILHINSVFTILNQIGVGPGECFRITGPSETWADFLGDRTDLEIVKTYMSQKVRLLFDPPTSSPIMDAINRSVEELEWRLSVTTE